ncbi:hypothetical protein ACUOFC_52460, partial [Escherichia sp. TWPC-MK]
AIAPRGFQIEAGDSEVASSIEKAVAGAPGKSGYNVPAILEALGGADNIVSLDNNLQVMLIKLYYANCPIVLQCLHINKRHIFHRQTQTGNAVIETDNIVGTA